MGVDGAALLATNAGFVPGVVFKGVTELAGPADIAGVTISRIVIRLVGCCKFE